MRLPELVADLPVAGGVLADVEIRGVCHDSRRVRRGDLFVAWNGERYDGRRFASQAVEQGAVAVLAPGPPESEIANIPWLTAADPRSLLGPLAARVYDHPGRELFLVGVTGTNGKTTVVALVAAILEAAGRPTGVLGTLGYRFGPRAYFGERTTPEASDLFRILREMQAAGAAAVAMEVSSHSLAQERVTAANFDVAVFTNLTRDHFDFHRDFEDYFSAKRRLFEQLKTGGRAVVNLEDAYGRRLAQELESPITFGAGGDVTLDSIELDERGTRGRITTPRGDYPFQSPLLGRYNASNLLAAAAVAEALELPQSAVAMALAATGPVPGRMELVGTGEPFPVLIDYAHTDAALEAALRSLRELTRRKIVLVFGCGGGKDRGKRPLMGRVAGELADLAILTSDNPRGEDPFEIIAAVEEGLKQSRRAEYRRIPDRRQAIRQAISEANPQCAVLVAGKGHEQVQIVGDRELPFSDREEVVRALEERFGAPAGR